MGGRRFSAERFLSIRIVQKCYNLMLILFDFKKKKR